MFGFEPRDREILLLIEERTRKIMASIDDLNAAVSTLQNAVSDASSALKDQASKLATASSLNPADVETVANRISSIAAGLESVVKSVNEPVTASAPFPAPATASEPAPAPAPAAEPTSAETAPAS